MFAALLSNLNESQRDAVSSPAQQLAILAGPGSGKTHTLTSRVAWLLASGLQAQNIIVATFTKKAANEMQERIGKLLGDDREQKLILGTFHSISVRYLRSYGYLIGIKKGFGVADQHDSETVIKRIIKKNNFMADPKATKNKISDRKAKGGWGEKMEKAIKNNNKEVQQIDAIYTEYEATLKSANLLDFDDLLLRCVDLLRDHPQCVSNVEAVLIDEFQDTNLVQFDLMRLMAASRKKVTIVGDPDQSIYGFRSAEVKNYLSLLRQYPDTITISLEENYRSSGAILAASLKIIQQDTSRIDKSLLATHTVGTRPVLRTLESAEVEGDWIMHEIRRCVTLTGGLITYGDVAILLRSAYLSRHIETYLGKAGVLYRMVGGRAFYDRVEVRLILYYLRVISNPADNNAFAEVVNLPKRGVGDVTVKSLIEEADQKRMSIWELMEKGPLATGLSAKARNGISQFMKIIKDARKKLSDEEGHTIASLMKHVIEAVELEDYLKKTYPDEEDYQSRLENVKEILALAEEADDPESSDYNDEPLPEVDGLEQNELSTPLSNFLAKISLATDKRAKDAEGEDKPRVTISTIHAAKGLEWPVVFIPGAYDGSIPNGRADDTDEERRLLYVGMTRAKALLYVSYPLIDSRRESTRPSNFLTPTSLLLHFGQKGPSFSKQNVIPDIAAILRLGVPKITFTPDELPLPSQEDDLWPEDGTAKARPPKTWDRWDGTAQCAEARKSLAHERPLIDKRNNEPWKPSYTTTMTTTPAFSTAAAVLREQPVNLSGAGSAKRPYTFDDDEVADKKSTKRSTKRPEGQPSLAAYFGKPQNSKANEPTTAITATRQTHTTQPSMSLPRMNHGPTLSQRGNPLTAIPAQTAPYVPPTICPTLSRHRIGGTTSTTTNRRNIRAFTPPESNGSNYIFLSSSPPRPEPGRKEHEAPRLPLPSNSIVTTATRPTSLHTTTEDRARAQPGRKSYGARMGMGGWEKRMGGSGSWKPPSMADK
ncbi:hypothetical protein VC83_05543 [Pseudogymnoascus destructans]|uniref:DNA 3'-5' helicase n=2 Tax=Pseudogymnoascus destructans TaxID=655981 RepID=L8FX23_PSED2|nr:uncharacterized protein VC83_05543 [Pseudogymnoascus destructans]ELR04266.1 hypothetical protein GMDG_06666 [Pseudogymnoascus destructans 20631-21]OAF57675.1 hypothetical protein VC83_05543 [Pseudogymnoascus destructans]